ncbi:DUF460 domain-containing protein [Methanoplanus sp. FWC-SCC4]|uniref:DUF460 domain-containing protein n=1 Tax=Methanochimaera problematica TaxID=2609417 RepID=A0AA97FB03_9EURY|nr:DUF460 domain-containing protein [Methanoplanus sp. FWC-SCC4]WOF15257.1 DUF460 domain-containing protein [Methanoplanus sp. FWC-SCC4]
MKVFGIDIIRGSVRSKSKRPVFAFVKREGGEQVYQGEVSLFRLQRIVSSEKPDILAVDSIQEISKNQQELFLFMQSLPPKTRLVQVTGGEKKDTLGVVAARYNLKFKNRFDPFVEARTIAHVAELGAGCEVIAFENSCDIIVSRSRSIGKGGWSQNRYIRKIHGAVLNRGRYVEDALKESGLRFEKTETKGFGGMRRVHFHVFAAKDDLPVSNESYSDVQIRVSAKRLDRIQYKPQSGKKKNLIVGIDPGTTVGVAAVDLEGNLVHLKSSRQMSLSDWIEEISSVGKPVVVASDVSRMPSSVEKIRRAFKAAAYTPREDRTQDEKAAVCISSGYSFNNDHERDSLAAALEAYKLFKNKFRSIERRVPPGYDMDTVRAGIIRGLSIEQILSEISPLQYPEKKGEPVAAGEVFEEKTPDESKVLNLEGMVKNLRLYVSDLETGLSERDLEIERLNKLLKSERSERAEKRKKSREISKLEAGMKSLKKHLRKEEKRNKKLVMQISRLKRFADLQMDGEFIPVKIIPAFTREGLRALEDDLGVSEGDILYVSRTEGWGNAVVSILNDARVSAVIAGSFDKKLEYTFRDLKIPIISDREIPVKVRGRIGTIKMKDLKKALSLWESRQETYETEKKFEMIESIVKEYRSERQVEARRRG